MVNMLNAVSNIDAVEVTNNMCRVVRIILITALVFVLMGCSTRSITPSRSEILRQARSRGVNLPTIEQERARYEELEAANKRRLMALIEHRARTSLRNSSYLIGPHDELEINVFDVPELNVTARVRESGFVSLPLVGAVKAQGLTEAEFTRELTKRLRTYVKNPQVSVFISHYGSQRVAVMGAVNKPGTYSLKKGVNSIMELIGEAGGISEKAGNYVNFIPVEVTGLTASNDIEARARLSLASSESSRLERNGIEILLDDVMGTSGTIPLEVPIRGGDMIIVPEAGQVMVEGEVEKRGTYELGQRMTLLGALAAAGGITYAANVHEVEVVRDIGGNDKLHIVVDLEKLASGQESDLRLKPGDIVRVPSDRGSRMRGDTFEGISRLINFGVGGTVNLAK
ncbi:MAG: hypothetical protein D6719_12470 [Candidatus Dadabacteria bacterium]|nr:MAG: hypothetical protein D6719_12470 [Candidatus Dadabacteria bacterium]